MIMHWALVFLHNNKVIGEQDFLKDQFFVYNGLYGIPTHCIWYCAPDKTKQIYQGIAFRLAFYSMGNRIIYIEDFVIERAHYNVSTQMYEIYAVSQVYTDFVMSDMLISKAFTTNRTQPISGKEVIKKIIESSFPRVQLYLNDNLVDRVKYFGFSFDLDFNCLDFITKICAENEWEWYLRGDALFVSECLQFEDSNVVIINPEPESSKIIHFFNYKYVEIPGETVQPGSWYGETGRVIWTTYICGGEIGGTIGLMIQNNRSDTLLEGAYLETLFGIDDKLIIQRQMKDYSQQTILVGKIFGKWSNNNRDEYEAPRFSGDVRKFTKWLRTREFKNKYSTDEDTLLYSENIRQTTPYAGNNVGIQYPQDESHHILISPSGDREDPLVGPAFFGFNEDIPKRDSNKDYRLQLPGAVIYIKEDGEIIIEQSGDGSSVPSGSGNYIKIGSDGTIYIDCSSQINIGDNSSAIQIGGPGALALAQALHTHPTGNLGITIPPGNPNTTKLTGA